MTERCPESNIGIPLNIFSNNNYYFYYLSIV
jgi:hypothetical protein